QRCHLLEQWQHLLEVHERWHRERAIAQVDLEATAGQLEERAGALALREQGLSAAEAELAQRQEALSQTRCYLEGWQARLAVRSAGGEAERAALLGEIEAHERQLGERLHHLEEVQRRHTERRQ